MAVRIATPRPANVNRQALKGHRMHRLLVLLAGVSCIGAGTIQGVVLEHVSSRPLARTVVRLDPVPGAGAAVRPLATRTGRAGQFVFPVIAPGIYLLTAVRQGYFPASYGQRLPIGRGTPIEVTQDSTVFAELRLRHKGAITGRVLDENGVGAPGIPVLAYRARLPLRSAGSALSDDRGIFRIHGLEPGKYWVRSGAARLDDGSAWLPVFATQAREVREARTYAVGVDADTPDADVIPEPGQLFSLAGTVTCDTDNPVPVVVTLSSETGRRRTQAACPRGGYRFEGLAPGVYEVTATLQDGSASGFIELFLDQDSAGGNIQVLQLPQVEIEVRRAGSNPVLNVPVKLMGRREDLSETEPEREINGPRTTLAPGHWELRARAPAGQFVESIATSRGEPRRPRKMERDSDWFEVFIEPRAPTRIRITLSDQSGEIAGRVVMDGKPSAGAPVFLWPNAESARRSLGGPLQVLSDTDGRFHFDSLPPGDYRVLASFDVYEIDEELIEQGRAAEIRVEAHQTASLDLPVWIAP